VRLEFTSLAKKKGEGEKPQHVRKTPPIVLSGAYEQTIITSLLGTTVSALYKLSYIPPPQVLKFAICNDTYEIVVGCKRTHSKSKNETMGIADTK
jgi:hypothetical protein